MRGNETWLEEEVCIEPGKILRALWKNFWWLGLICFLCGLIAWGISRLLPPEYESGAIFYVKNNTSNAGSISSADIAASKELVESYLVILESGETLEEVIRYAGSHRSRTEIREMISASAVNATEFFKVVVTAPSAQEAQTLAGAIVQVLPRRIAGILEGTSAKIVDTAVSEPKGAEIQQGIFAVAGILAGLCLSVSVITVGTILDKSICTKEDVVRASGVPVLAVVSRRDTCASESTRILRAKIRYLFKEKDGCSVLGVTDVAGGDGQTAEKLAAALARQGDRVLLLTWDLRKNSLWGRKIDRNHPGIEDYLGGNAALEDILQSCTLETGKIRLSVSTAGAGRTNPADLWGDHGIAALFLELRERYDWIILELPPTKVCSGVLEAVCHTDGVLLQVHQNCCNAEELKEIIDALAFVEAPVLGAIFCTASGEKKKRKKHRYER